MQPNWRKCTKCGAVTKFSDLDKNIPDAETFVCPRCQKQKTGRVKNIGKVKDDKDKSFRSDGIEGTKSHNPKLWGTRASKMPEMP